MNPQAIYNRLYRAFGPQEWWPTYSRDRGQATRDKPFEICVGAILTQNTAWTNVEKAIVNLHSVGVMEPTTILSTPMPRLAQLVRPAGYFRQKAKKLKIFSKWFLEEWSGDFSRMRRVPLIKLRARLLSVWGIGPETADSILLYALGKPSFVVDAYTKRLCDCFGIAFKDYHEYQKFFTSSLPKSTKIYNEYHALIVAWGKLHKKDPLRARELVK